jgi:hypothetical protein
LFCILFLFFCCVSFFSFFKAKRKKNKQTRKKYKKYNKKQTNKQTYLLFCCHLFYIDFEKRFYFHDVKDFPQPDEFEDIPKQYSSSKSRQTCRFRYLWMIWIITVENNFMLFVLYFVFVFLLCLLFFIFQRTYL